MKKNLLRLIDANLNRSREGLRVCEEIARFVLEDKTLTAGFKDLRHKVSSSIQEIPFSPKELLRYRNSQSDVGRDILNKSVRKNYKDVFFANIQRVKESLRVLEEFSNIFNQSHLSNYFANLRFKIYALEKKTTARL